MTLNPDFKSFLALNEALVKKADDDDKLLIAVITHIIAAKLDDMDPTDAYYDFLNCSGYKSSSEMFQIYTGLQDDGTLIETYNGIRKRCSNVPN